MPDLNRFIVHQKNHIKALQNSPLIGFTGQHGKPATWDDAAWEFTTPEGKKIHYYFINNSIKRASFVREYQHTQLLVPHSRHLAMAYAFAINTSSNSWSYKVTLHSSFRQFLAMLDDNPANLSSAALADLVNRLAQPHIFSKVGQWLLDNNFIPQSTRIPSFKKAQRAGYDIIAHKKTKLPDDKIIAALGEITFKTISPEPDNWPTHSLDHQLDAFICGMSALALASPNRVGAEQTILAKQQLKEQVRPSKKGEQETVHYLNWPGSKGYHNYNNHIVSNMVEPLERCLNYFIKVCEPGRVLARFYENPDQPLKSVLGDFTPAAEKRKDAKNSWHKPVHLVQLGWFLGFYDNCDGMVYVSQDTEGAERSCKKGKSTYTKAIAQLKPTDKLHLTFHTTKTLLGRSISRTFIHHIFGNNAPSVEEFQRRWIEHSYANLTGFPYGYNTSMHGKIAYQQALFCFTGHQIFTNSSSYKAGGSFYALTAPTSLNEVFKFQIGKLNANCTTNIFTRHGFSDDFHIRAHQLRHWMNDTAERQGIPHAMINLWSGRKTPEQLLHYCHRTHDEKGHEVYDLMFAHDKKDASNEVRIKIISQKEYESLVKTAAAVHATGLCTANLIYSPCEHLNDFESQCALCPSSCHVNRDQEAIELLEKDLAVQNRRLNEVQRHPNFHISEAMQKWFMIHHRNTSILGELVGLMKSTDIKEGSLIRLLTDVNEIRITDLQNRTIEKRTLALPNAEEILAKALADKTTEPSESNPLNDVLEALGWD